MAPATNDDPYRWQSPGAWTVYFDVDASDKDAVAIWLAGEDDPLTALLRLVDGLDAIGRTRRYRDVAVPPCRPGHGHRAAVETHDGSVLIRCPQTGEVLHQVTPALPPSID